MVRLIKTRLVDVGRLKIVKKEIITEMVLYQNVKQEKNKSLFYKKIAGFNINTFLLLTLSSTFV